MSRNSTKSTNGCTEESLWTGKAATVSSAVFEPPNGEPPTITAPNDHIAMKPAAKATAPKMAIVMSALRGFPLGGLRRAPPPVPPPLSYPFENASDDLRRGPS